MAAQQHVVSIVLNGVVGDSRVIKTAKAAEAAGYRATIVGMAVVPEVTRLEVEGTQVVQVPSPLPLLQREKLWPADKEKRQLWLMVEGALEAMAPVIDELRPDLLHSHDMSGLRIGAAVSRRLAAKGRVVPWVHDLHEFVVGLTTVPETYRQSSMEYERRYLRQADHLITVSDRLAEEVRSIYHLRRPPTVIYNAPAQVEFSAAAPDVRSQLGLDSSAKLVVYIGVAKKERGCETIVRAAASLPGVHLCFVSDSAYVSSLRDLAQQLGMAARFHAVPYVPSDQVVSYIRTADVGTHGLIHYPNGEVAMPNKMFEYLQAGIPMVVSDVAEMKRFVETYGVGCVFEAENAISCAKAIRDAFARKAELAGNITDELKREYSWQAQAEKLRKIYDGLLQHRPQRALLLTDLEHLAEANPAPNEDLGIVDAAAPDVECDFYLDPSTVGDRAGMLSRIAAKYDALRLVAPLRWPTTADLMALGDAGVDVHGVGESAAARKREGRAPALLPALEETYLQADDVALRALFERGKLESKLASMQPVDQSVFVELKAAKKKEGRLTATIKEQKRKIAELEAAGAGDTQRLVPTTLLATFRRKLFGPTLR